MLEEAVKGILLVMISFVFLLPLPEAQRTR
jgi:hypothetical protein